MIELLALGAGLAWLLSGSRGATPNAMNTPTMPVPASLTSRERAILMRVAETNPHLLEWVPIELASGGHTGTLFASPDYWGLGAEYATYLRTPLTPKAAQWVAGAFDAGLPTRKMVDLIERNAQIIPMIGMSPQSGESRNSQRLWDASNATVQRRMPPGGGLVAGHKKDVIIGNVRARNPGKVIIYGARNSDGSRLQATSDAHGDFYVDYSHGLRLIRNDMVVDGQPRRVRDVLMDRNLAGLISDEGAVSPSGVAYPV